MSNKDNIKAIENIIAKELERQQSTLELIASENFVSPAVMQAQGSILTNKYAEGYPHHRYYGGCKFVDEIEEIAIEQAKKLFKCNYANVQPHSGSQANQAVFLALLKPGDTILGMGLSSGGHLTRGASPNLSGKWFNSIYYGVRKDNFLIDYDEISDLAEKYRPKLITAGYSAYSREIDFKKFRDIADNVGAYLLADIAHIAGLVAAQCHSSPFPYAHVATATTHKTLRGPRGGLIICDDIDTKNSLGKKINAALFPGMQGGPLMHVIAAKAIAFIEASKPEYREYIKQVILNSKILAQSLNQRGYDIVTGGTDNHMVLVDLRKNNITGKYAEATLEEAGITCNKNTIPFDNTSPTVTSGIRLGTAACTSRGMKEADFQQIGSYIAQILENPQKKTSTRNAIKEMCRNFPIYA